MVGGGVLGQRRHLAEQLGAERGGEPGGDADVVESLVVVEQAEQQRADAAAVLVHAEPGHHAVGGALVLDLDQGPLVGLVHVVEPLGHHAVEARPLERREPFGRHGAVGARRGHEDRCGCARRAGGVQHAHELGAAVTERPSQPRLVAERQQVEGDEHARRLGGEARHPRRRRVDPLEQGVEVESVAVPVGHDDLAVDDAPLGQRRPQGLHELGEVAGDRAFLAAGEVELVAVAGDDASEPVPLRLERPVVAGRDLPGELRQHRLDRQGDRQHHHPSVPADDPPALHRFTPSGTTRPPADV